MVVIWVIGVAVDKGASGWTRGVAVEVGGSGLNYGGGGR